MSTTNHYPAVLTNYSVQCETSARRLYSISCSKLKSSYSFQFSLLIKTTTFPIFWNTTTLSTKRGMILDTSIKVIIGIFIGVQTWARLLSISDNSFGLETLSAPSLLSFYISKKKKDFLKKLIKNKLTLTHSRMLSLSGLDPSELRGWPDHKKRRWSGFLASQRFVSMVNLSPSFKVTLLFGTGFLHINRA